MSNTEREEFFDLIPDAQENFSGQHLERSITPVRRRRGSYAEALPYKEIYKFS